MKYTTIKYFTQITAIKIPFIGAKQRGQNIALIMIGFAMLLSSCKKKNDVPPASYQDGAYFITARKANGHAVDAADLLRLTFNNDFSFYNAINPLTTQDTIWLPQVRIVGLPADHSRTLDIVAVDTGTTAVANKHYKLLSYTVPSGSYVSNKIGVVVYRVSELDDSSVKLMLRLKPNTDFPAPMVGNEIGYDASYFTGDTFTISLTNKAIEPQYWQQNINALFHAWSKVKYDFITDTIHKRLGIVENDPDERANLFGYYIQVKTALYNYNLANPGNPLTDENGNSINL